MFSKMPIPFSRVALLSSGFALGLVLNAEPAPTYAQAPGDEVFGSDDFWSRNDERAPQCGSLNSAHRDLTRQWKTPSGKDKINLTISKQHRDGDLVDRKPITSETGFYTKISGIVRYNRQRKNWQFYVDKLYDGTGQAHGVGQWVNLR